MIRLLEEEDIPAVLEIEQLCFASSPWSEEAYLYEITNMYSRMFVVERDETIVGVFGTYILFEQAQIVTIATHPAYQKQGIAKEMMTYMKMLWEEEGCESCTLEVRVSNTKAIAMYENFGFVHLGIRESYYENGEDAYLMGIGLGGLS